MLRGCSNDIIHVLVRVLPRLHKPTLTRAHMEVSREHSSLRPLDLEEPNQLALLHVLEEVQEAVQLASGTCCENARMHIGYAPYIAM